jgi:hypothetical protein
VIITKEHANRIREGPNGRRLSSHFASSPELTFVINGFSTSLPRKWQGIHKLASVHAIESAASVDPDVAEPHPIISMSTVNQFDVQDDHEVMGGVPLTWTDLKGRGGGSFANHSPNGEGNASIVPDRTSRCSTDMSSRYVGAYALILVARRFIPSGAFIRVDYGKGFVNSKRSNL